MDCRVQQLVLRDLRGTMSPAPAGPRGLRWLTTKKLVRTRGSGEVRQWNGRHQGSAIACDSFPACSTRPRVTGPMGHIIASVERSSWWLESNEQSHVFPEA